jgi:hypothetical protein
MLLRQLSVKALRLYFYLSKALLKVAMLRASLEAEALALTFLG